MRSQKEEGSKRTESVSREGQMRAPVISLPKGGGAIRGIGEKFAANPVTGTGSMSVPIATSPGRSGFGPQLSLSYDSGSGNGPFGFGWSLSLPSITRKTDKGLPRYWDAEESDVFILSGAEDLVPVLKEQNGKWVRDSYERTVNSIAYRIQRYRPRIEGLFARIERWTRQKDGDVHWRSISKDNILTLYGKDSSSRIADPEDPRRIFSWLICETRDDKGNAVLYEYKAEDGSGVDLTCAHERNRGSHNDLRRTANRYLKKIRYGNRTPLLNNEGNRPLFLSELPAEDIADDQWMFEVVFDYGEHDANTPKPGDPGSWTRRQDPFSTYRAGFEVRTTRLCQRVLMFHHFPNEEDIGQNCLVRSTDFTYSHEQDPENVRNPVYTYLCAVTQSGYKRNEGGYQKRSLPPVEFNYTQPVVQDAVEEVDPTSLENLPVGVDGAAYQWTDLHGEGIPGVLTEQADAWYYKRNLSPINEEKENGIPHIKAKLAPLEQVASKPNLALAGGRAQFMDLAGDGQPDLVVLDDPVPGLYEHDGDESWQSFRPFTSRLNRNMRDANLKFVDLNGDGHADVLISEDEALIWHPSLAEAGFGPAYRVAQALDEEKGPRLVLADGTDSIYLADLSGDGLTDLVRIRSGEVCYWPNLGHGRFGAKITMDHAPQFDHPDQFDPKRIRLADIDGTDTTDIIYLHRDGIRLYFNQSGNSWGAVQILNVFPHVDELVNIAPTDLLGNGTACLVWSSPLPGDARRAMRYVNLMGDQKPHLLRKTVNNLGAETRVHYAPSTKFYLKDKQEGRPWITKLPFPVHVVERVEIHDHISRNRFVTRYAYHHGYFDGIEREFRGFGMVEQWDTEEFATLEQDGMLDDTENLDQASHIPPVRSLTWFHTGVYLDRDYISRQFENEYYREPGLGVDQGRDLLLPDTILPDNLTIAEEREACRALKGSMIRQEVYAQDGTDKAEIPFIVTERNFTIRRLQPHNGNQHAVFFIHPREAISYHYERNPTDPRISHTLTLEVDKYGNVLKEAAIGYGRKQGQSPLQGEDKKRQEQILLTYTENEVTNAIDLSPDDLNHDPNNYRTPLPCETRTYELTDYTATGVGGRFQANDFVQPDPTDPSGRKQIHIFDGEVNYEDEPSSGRQRRLIEQVRTLYRKDDLTALLPLGELQPLALAGETCTLAFTPGLLAQVFKRKQAGQPDVDLLPANPAPLLEGKGADQGGYVAIDGKWWIPTGRVFYSDNPNHTAVQELAEARSHFFLPCRYRDPFGYDTLVAYDGPADLSASRYDLLVTRTTDALNNTVTATNDYRVLQPRLVTDCNNNRTAAAFDALGMVVATAVMGKEGEDLGDLLEGFDADPPLGGLQAFIADPQAQAASLLGKATTRIVYDLDRYQRAGQPPFAATLARETHFHDPGGAQTKIQISFSFSDGFGREIQQKIQAEAGDAPQRQADVPLPTDDIRPGDLVRDVQGNLVQANTPRRWVGSGRTVFNNKGKPVRQYEPFFSATHLYEPERDMTDTGVSLVLFYDPIERVVATLHPNHTWEKVVFDPWMQATWDVNDTVAADPRTDKDISGYVKEYFKEVAPKINDWNTWLQERNVDPENPPADTPPLDPKIKVAIRTLKHKDTPTVAHFDTLGRPFLTVADNGLDNNGKEQKYETRVLLDIEGNRRAVIDAKDRVVMRYDYYVAGPGEEEDEDEEISGNLIHQASMEAGERWMLNNVAGNPIYQWDSRGHTVHTLYDALQRPTHIYLRKDSVSILTERLIYGEGHPDASCNLRSQLYLHFDQAGLVTNERFDFKGNLLEHSRQLAQEYKDTIDWPLQAATIDLGNLSTVSTTCLEQEKFTSISRYDALDRPIMTVSPHNPTAKPNVIQPTYNEANLLDKIDVWLHQTNPPQQLLDPNTADQHIIANIDYNAKGQRKCIEYGNSAKTEYAYDKHTFRLTHLFTTRGAGFPQNCKDELGDIQRQQRNCPKPQPVCEGVQNLWYTYDPIGNITHIQDDAQQTVYFNNQCVEPSADYTYDAIYRLMKTTGREHLGQAGANPTQPTHTDGPRTNRPHPSDGRAMGRYTEEYLYDEVGNILKMFHQSAAGNWTRYYAYDEPSLLEPGTGKRNNRLSATSRPGDNPLGPYSDTYSYQDNQGNDVHGCMTSMPHLPKMEWDYEDKLHTTATQATGSGTPETTYYIYDSGGQRVRKITERQNGTRRKERIYLGGFEIYREFNGNGTTKTLERETLHIMDDQKRVALIETKTIDTDDNTNLNIPLLRYQFDNHLGSASLELDENADIISYEEFYPYGSTSYHAVNKTIEAAAKCYRYTGKERDEETGLYYHGARYYAPWLGRWINVDPIGIEGGINLYEFASSNPVMKTDNQGLQPEDPEENAFYAQPSNKRKESKKYDPELGVPKSTLTLYDKLLESKVGVELRSEISKAAKIADIDPGFLAMTLMAEVSFKTGGTIWLNKGPVLSYQASLDYFPTYIPGIKKRNIPGFSSIKITRNVRRGSKKFLPVLDEWKNKQGTILPVITFASGKDALLAMAVKIKFAEYRLKEIYNDRNVFKNKGKTYESLPIEIRFALLRYYGQPGRQGIRRQIDKVVKGERFLVRKMMGKKAGYDRRATYHAAQAIHISQKYFGRKFMTK